MNRTFVLPACLTLAGLVLLSPAQAWPIDGCKFKAERHAQVDATGAKSIAIRAGAGDMTVRGRQSATVAASGKACAPSQALLDQTTILVVREGDVIRISTQIPPAAKAGVANLWGSTHPSIDIDIELPAGIPIAIEDSSGDMTVAHIAAGSIHDSSGDLEVDDVAGDLQVFDSSGDIRISGVRGKLTLEDSSGDMTLHDIKGDVLVKVDSSGDIGIVNAGANVNIDGDGSGDIDVDGVAGNFTLGSKGSGDVNVHGVRGTVSIPDYKR